jgi:hypothetical protein
MHGWTGQMVGWPTTNKGHAEMAGTAFLFNKNPQKSCFEASKASIIFYSSRAFQLSILLTCFDISAATGRRYVYLKEWVPVTMQQTNYCEMI